jgi:NTP pyrophosphatase (non-canonical NTP hydrolase)
MPGTEHTYTTPPAPSALEDSYEVQQTKAAALQELGELSKLVAAAQANESMTLNEIIDECLRDSEDWFPEVSTDPAFMILALAGEVGEVCNVAKKVVRGSLTADEGDKLIGEEITDVFIYLMNLVGIMREDFGFDLIAAYKKKREFNISRFGQEASVEA